MQPDFVSDGCTGFPDVWRGIDLSGCCYAHDLAWWMSDGDWQAWFTSNVDLGVCFFNAGAWEVALPGFLAITIIGAALFAAKGSGKKHG